jgi:hypothetical protein
MTVRRNTQTRATKTTPVAAKAKPGKVGGKRNKMQAQAEPRAGFPIVGIGASAGGLAAFEAFFSGMPANSLPGMAFVLVQHLAPDHKSILAELIKRCTSMEVFEVEDGMVVQANCTYIIPPNRDMAILNGSLRLFEPAAPRGRRMSIDFFFRSLAQEQHERAICIVLSGTGSDGTQGVRDIKGEGGMVMVQRANSTEYDGMPRSAIATGLVDYELLPAEMPAQLIAYLRRAFGKKAQAVSRLAFKNASALEKNFVLLRTQTGHDFSQYKPEPIMVQPKDLGNRSTPGKMSLRELTEQALLRQVASSGALVNGHGDILYLHGRTGMYLEPAPGEVGVYNILKMARQGLRGELTTALHRAAGIRAQVRRTGLLVKTNGDFTPTTLTITPLAARPESSRQGGEVTDPAATLSASLYLIILEEGPSFDPEQARLAAAGDAEEGATDPDSSSLFRANARIAALRQELWAKEEYLQTANEELKSANEELQSEELQSTNEELEPPRKSCNRRRRSTPNCRTRWLICRGPTTT